MNLSGFSDLSDISTITNEQNEPGAADMSSLSDLGHMHNPRNIPAPSKNNSFHSTDHPDMTKILVQNSLLKDEVAAKDIIIRKLQLELQQQLQQQAQQTQQAQIQVQQQVQQQVQIQQWDIPDENKPPPTPTSTKPSSKHTILKHLEDDRAHNEEDMTGLKVLHLRLNPPILDYQRDLKKKDDRILRLEEDILNLRSIISNTMRMSPKEGENYFQVVVETILHEFKNYKSVIDPPIQQDQSLNTDATTDGISPNHTFVSLQKSKASSSLEHNFFDDEMISSLSDSLQQQYQRHHKSDIMRTISTSDNLTLYINPNNTTPNTSNSINIHNEENSNDINHHQNINNTNNISNIGNKSQYNNNKNNITMNQQNTNYTLNQTNLEIHQENNSSTNYTFQPQKRPRASLGDSHVYVEREKYKEKVLKLEHDLQIAYKNVDKMREIFTNHRSIVIESLGYKVDIHPKEVIIRPAIHYDIPSNEPKAIISMRRINSEGRTSIDAPLQVARTSFVRNLPENVTKYLDNGETNQFFSALTFYLQHIYDVHPQD